MAHSYVEAHDSEMDAFRTFAELYPETILLVDTYDTLDGVRKVIDLAEEKGDDFAVRGIRLDSGDLAALASEARRLLDGAGLHDVQIFASSGLDEYAITDLLEQGAPIDGFGVGTKMGTSADQPALDSAYKLCGYAGQPRMKLAAEKSNLPGRKQVIRQYEDGVAVRDVIATEADDNHSGSSLLDRVMSNGERTDAGTARPLEAHREHAAARRSELPDTLRRLDGERAYDVVLSDRMEERLSTTRAELKKAMTV
jgi:nicotinate phosphoribosyltransferase